MPLQLFVNRFEIRLRALRRWLLALTLGEEGSFEPLIIPVVRQRPPEFGGLGAFEVVKNGGLANRATACDLPLPQSQFVSESKYLLDPTHG
jgi:hypothetical protein